MQNNNTDPYNKANRTSGDKSSNNPARDKMDLTDSKRDQERLQGDENNHLTKTASDSFREGVADKKADTRFDEVDDNTD